MVALSQVLYLTEFSWQDIEGQLAEMSEWLKIWLKQKMRNDEWKMRKLYK